MSPNPQGSPPARRPRPLQRMSPGVKLICPRTTYRMKYENRTTRLQTTHRYPTRDGTRLHCTNGSNTKKSRCHLQRLVHRQIVESEFSDHRLPRCCWLHLVRTVKGILVALRRQLRRAGGHL